MTDSNAYDGARREQQLLLGSLIHTRTSSDRHVADLGEGITAAWFANEKDRALFQAIEALHERGEESHVMAIEEQLRADDNLRVCPRDYVESLIRSWDYPVTALVERVEAAYLRRSLKEELIVSRGALEKGASPGEVWANLQDTVEESMIGSGRARNGLQMVEDALASALASIADPEMSGNRGLGTGYDAWNAVAQLEPGQMTVVAARPGGCKTTLLQNVAAYHARFGRQVAFFSIETRQRDMEISLASIVTEVPARAIKAGEINEQTYERMSDQIEACQRAGGRVSVFTAHPMTVGFVTAMARRNKRKHGLDLILVDYLQLLAPMASGRRSENRQVEVAALSGALKGLAVQMDVPVLVAAQLNRGIEDGGKDRKPRMSDLRESGAIEQDADVVLMLQNEEGDDGEKLIRAHVVKNRNGPLDSFHMHHKPACRRLVAHYRKTEAMEVNHAGM